MDDYFRRNCGNNGTDRYLSYKNVTFYTGSVNNEETASEVGHELVAVIANFFTKSIFFITSVLLFYIVWQKALS